MKLLNTSSLGEKTGWSPATIRRREKQDQDFPKPVVIQGRKYWRDTEIDHYVDLKAQDDNQPRSVGARG